MGIYVARVYCFVDDAHSTGVLSVRPIIALQLLQYH